MNIVSYFIAPGINGPGFGYLTDRKIREIEFLVCEANGETPERIKQRSRTRGRVLSRHMIFYFLRQHTTLTCAQIGHLYGIMDHSTVLHGIRTLEGLIFSEPHIKKQMQLIGNKLTVQEFLIP